MKIKALYFTKATYVGVMTGKVDDSTHDINPWQGGCYLAIRRATGLGYLVHASTCTAEVELPPGDQVEVPEARKRKGAPVPA